MRNLPMAFSNSCYAKIWTNKTMTFHDLCTRLEQTIRTTESAEEYPKLPKAERDRIKDKGGFIGGQLRDNRRKRENVVCRSMLTLDMDHSEPDFIDRFVLECRYVACLYTTHGFILPVPGVLTVQKRRLPVISRRYPFCELVVPKKIHCLGCGVTRRPKEARYLSS